MEEKIQYLLSQQEHLRNSKQKRGLLKFFIFLLILIPICLYSYSFLFLPRQESYSVSKKKPITPTSVIVQKTKELKKFQINDFPIYPNAEFITYELSKPCIGQESGFSTCGSQLYSWQTPEDYDRVNKYFVEDKAKSGWKCSGGAGFYDTKRAAQSSTICTKAELSYALDLLATSSATTITLIIPDNSDPAPIISEELISPSTRYQIAEEAIGDSQAIMIKDKNGRVLYSDIISKNYETIGYGTNFDCHCTTRFYGWTDPSHFVIRIRNEDEEEYEYIVNAAEGSVMQTSFKRIQ